MEANTREKLTNTCSLGLFFIRAHPDAALDGVAKTLTDQILALFTEAGYLSHEEVQSMLNTLSGGLPEIAEIQGYVKLADLNK